MNHRFANIDKKKSNYYSYTYSRKIVINFVRKYSRATKLFGELFKWTLKQTITQGIIYFRFYQDKWNNFKYCIKRIHKGDSADVWLESKERDWREKIIKKVFEGTYFEKSKAYPYLPTHQLRYFEKYLKE